MQQRVKSFPLRSGICAIYPDRIELDGKSITYTVSSLFTKWGIARYIWLHAILTLTFVLSLILFLALNNYFLALFFLFAMGFTLRLMWLKRRETFVTIIPRKQIDRIQFHPAVPGEKRASFTILFTPHHTQLKRKIVLPTRKGEMIAQSAYLMMKDTGMLSADKAE